MNTYTVLAFESEENAEINGPARQEQVDTLKQAKERAKYFVSKECYGYECANYGENEEKPSRHKYAQVVSGDVIFECWAKN